MCSDQALQLRHKRWRQQRRHSLFEGFWNTRRRLTQDLLRRLSATFGPVEINKGGEGALIPDSAADAGELKGGEALGATGSF